MKPFAVNGKLPEGKLHFNYRLSIARMVVETVFQRLKGRWRLLLKQNEASIEQMNEIVSACCIFNIYESENERFDGDLDAIENEIFVASQHNCPGNTQSDLQSNFDRR